jgi:putative ABC transport system permease protein
MSLAPLALWLRRLRVDRAQIAVLAVTVFATAFLAAAGPLLAVRASSDALRAELAHANPAERNLVVSTAQVLQVEPRSDQLAAETDRLRRLFGGSMPTQVARILGDARSSYATEPWVVLVEGQPPNPVRRTLVLTARPTVTDHLQLVDGRLPGAGSFDPPPVEQDPDHPVGGTLHLELAMSRATATAMGIEVGDHLGMDERTRFGFSVGLDEQVEPTVIGEVVGLYDVPAPDEEFWAGDHRLVAASVGDFNVDGAAILSLDGLTTLLASWPHLLTIAYTYPIVADGVVAASPAGLVAAIRDLRQAFNLVDAGSFFPLDARTGLGTLLTRYLAGQRQAFLLLGLVGIGVAGIAAAALLLLGVLLADRRRGALLIQRERGAGPLQLLGPAALEAIVITVPVALAGWLLATRLMPASAGDLPLRLALAVAGAATVACVAMVLPVAVRDLRGLLRTSLAPAHPSARRLVVDGLVIALAVVGVVFVRSRGVSGAAPGSQAGDLNVYLAAVPLLAGLAAGLVVLRIYPYPVRALARLAGRLRGLVTPLALRRAGRAPGAVHVPLVALLVAAALGAFGATVAASIGNGQSVAAWRETGADYRVTSLTGGLPTTIDVAAIEGVEAIAGLWTDPDALLISSNGGARLALIALDPAEIAAVTGGTPADPRLPAGLEEQPAGDLGTTAAPLPALIMSSLGDFRRQIGTGDTFQLSVLGSRVAFSGIAARGSFPGVPVGQRFVVVARDLLARAVGLPELRAGTLLVRGRDGLAAAIRDEVTGSGQVAFVVARQEVVDGLRDAPLVTTVTLGFLVSLAVAAGYVTLTLVIGLLLAAAARSRDVAYLRTMGLSAGQSLRMAILEQVPPIIVAVAAGAGLGLAIVALIGRGLNLGAFAGADITADLTIDWLLLVVAGAWLIAVAAIGVGIGALAARRVDPSRALRIGD